VISIFIVFLACMLIYLSRKNILPLVNLKSRKNFALITGLLLIIGLSVPLFYHMGKFALIQKRIEKINEYISSDNAHKHEDTYHTNSITERVFLWKNAWRMFKDHPVTGAGFDNWKIYATKYELPYSKYVIDNSTRYIRPHNDLLLILAEGGIIGFVLFISLFVSGFILAFRLFHTSLPPNLKMILLLSLSGLVIYLTIACFSLPGDRFYTQVLLFVYFAVICGLYDTQDIAAPSGSRHRAMAAICIASILSGVSIAYIGMIRYASEVHLIYALQAQNKKDWQKMGYHAAMAKSFFFPIDYTATPIAWYQGMAAFNSGAPTISKYYFEEALRCNPYDLLVLNDLATAIQREGDNAKAIRIYDQVLGMAPYFISSFMNKVVVLYNQGDKDSAYTFLHTYPIFYHADDNYDHILGIMLTNKTMEAIPDTLLARRYLKNNRSLLRMDSVATADHIPFEQLVLRDTMLIGLRKRLDQAPKKQSH
jgi:hypothetical protein